mmetsp:Transcript_14201/g.30392  ORF Transcript_14201/g.30392 Transcript_14201/m.30392 type:complete len:244 (-) Transcript_14201:1426-2157(-)
MLVRVRVPERACAVLLVVVRVCEPGVELLDHRVGHQLEVLVVNLQQRVAVVIHRLVRDDGAGEQHDTGEDEQRLRRVKEHRVVPEQQHDARGNARPHEGAKVQHRRDRRLHGRLLRARHLPGEDGRHRRVPADAERDHRDPRELEEDVVEGHRHEEEAGEGHHAAPQHHPPAAVLPDEVPDDAVAEPVARGGHQGVPGLLARAPIVHLVRVRQEHRRHRRHRDAPHEPADGERARSLRPQQYP